MMMIIRYTKINGVFKTSACLAITSAFYYFAEGFYNKIAGVSQRSITFSFNFRDWGNNVQVNNNINAIILFSLWFLVLAFAVAGIITQLKKSKRSTY